MLRTLYIINALLMLEWVEQSLSIHQSNLIINNKKDGGE